jgi:hypothetical protein
MLRAIALDGRLEVRLRGGEAALPERGDAEHVVALDAQDVVAVALPAPAQLLCEPSRALEVAAGEGGHGDRPQERRLGLVPDRLGQREPALLEPGEPR